MGHARALLALAAHDQARVAAQVVERGLSVRDTERLVHELGRPRRPRSPRSRDADTLRLETALAEHLGAKVQIEPGRNGSGKVVIRYASLDELDGIVARVGAAMA